VAVRPASRCPSSLALLPLIYAAEVHGLGLRKAVMFRFYMLMMFAVLYMMAMVLSLAI
jgi:hypothetical protein